MKLILTQRDIERIAWALKAGYEQHCKFVRHDKWKDNLTEEQIKGCLRTDRKFILAKNKFRLAIIKAKEK